VDQGLSTLAAMLLKLGFACMLLSLREAPCKTWRLKGQEELQRIKPDAPVAKRTAHSRYSSQRARGANKRTRQESQPATNQGFRHVWALD
jgi:hypothetical protein